MNYVIGFLAAATMFAYLLVCTGPLDTTVRRDPKREAEIDAKIREAREERLRTQLLKDAQRYKEDALIMEYLFKR